MGLKLDAALLVAVEPELLLSVFVRAKSVVVLPAGTEDTLNCSGEMYQRDDVARDNS